jgi:hypothetical protein
MKVGSKYFVFLLITGFVVSFSLNSVFGQSEKIIPEMKLAGHKVIRLNYTFGVDPATAIIPRGTTVIFMNAGRSIANIKFNGKQVTLACKSPVHFVVDEKGSFTSNEIPPGAVASLCFVEKGTFDYIVTQETPKTDPTGAPRESKGKIIVE